jgi:hypothetical protein
MGIALTTAALNGDFRQYRHRDFFRRDGAEVEPGRRRDPGERVCGDASPDELLAKHAHIAAAADEGVVFGIDRGGGA